MIVSLATDSATAPGANYWLAAMLFLVTFLAIVSEKVNKTKAALFGWVLFDWAAQPFFTLLTTFIYAPYFANTITGDPVRGQALWGYATAAAGLGIALCSPLLGAVADAAGRRKPWIATFGLVFVIATSMLWFGKPNDPATIPVVLIAFAFSMLAVEFATVFNNAMMPSLVPAGQLGRLSGYGWAIGYVGDEIAESRGGDATRPESEVRKPPWMLPARFASVRGQSYRVVYRARSNATRGERPHVWSDARRRG